MSDAELQPPVDEACRRRFEAAWQQGTPKPIDACLPPEEESAYLATLEELVQIELEYQWEAWSKGMGRDRRESSQGSPDHPPRIEDYLARFPQLDDARVLERLLLQEYLVRMECGDDPTVDEYRERFPDLEIPGWDVSTSIEVHALDETDRSRSLSASAQEVGEVLTPAHPKRFGNYDLLEEIGQGGMGVVYRARQRGADRDVGLKVIRRELLQSRSDTAHAGALERFRHEVQAAARLEHQNIVSVYEVGDVDGEPFFSMQYVDGASLGELLRVGPIENRRAARFLQQVTQAVAEAHRADILHRDLKPQNILVEAATDQPLVVDFGLAKLLESDDDLTRSGDIIGSPPYMSPEQARDSSRVTTQSDVYALGATLYHILTGRPPFQAATGVETLRQVVDDEPVPPRRLNRLIDRDLETICLKCLEKQPARRYDSADELADELGRYLNHQPIRARAIGPLGRTWRCCQRYPVTAASMALAAVFLIAALVAATVGYVQTSASLAVAEQAKTQSDESFREARSAVDRFFTRVSETELLDRPGLQRLRVQLLEETTPYYERFLKQRDNDPAIRDELATAHFRLGRIRELIGEEPDKALQAYKRAREIQQELRAKQPDDAARLAALGETVNGIGRILHRMGDFAGAIKAYEEAVKVRSTVVTLDPHATEYRRKLANTYMNMGQTAELIDLARARQHHEEAQDIRKDLNASGAGNAEIQRDLAMGHYNLAALDIHAAGEAAAKEIPESPATADDPVMQHLIAAEEHLESAIDIFEELLEANPQRIGNKHRLATCYRMLADLKGDLGQIDEAFIWYEMSRQHLRELVAANPDVAEYRATLAGLCMNVGLLHTESNEAEDARAELTEAKDLLERLSEESATPGFQRDLAVTLRERGKLLSDTTAGRESIQAAEQILQSLVESWPENQDFRLQLTETQEALNELGAPSSDGS